MRGSIKHGEGPLIGNAGEHYVLAELLKRGCVAGMTPRNAPAFDILGWKGSRQFRIRVKTKTDEINDWQFAAKKDGTIFLGLASGADYTVLVNLADELRDMEFFVLRTKLLDKWLQQDFQDWVTTPGPRKPQRDPKNPKRHLSHKKFHGRLLRHKDRWSLITGSR